MTKTVPCLILACLPLGAAIALLGTLVSAPAAAQVYSVVDIGTLGGENSHATGINESGQVIGVSNEPSGSDHPFFFDSGVLSDLIGPSAADFAFCRNLDNQIVTAPSNINRRYAKRSRQSRRRLRCFFG